VRERPADVLLGDEAQLDQGFADAAAGLALAREPDVDLGGRDRPGLDEDGRDVLALGVCRSVQSWRPGRGVDGIAALREGGRPIASIG
jgi:hypothetical protein